MSAQFKINFLLIGLTLLVLPACSGNTRIVRHTPSTSVSLSGKVLVAEIQWLHALEETPQEQWFERGNAQGFIQHRGGLVEPTAPGERIRSKETSISRRAMFAELFSQWHRQQVQSVFGGRALSLDSPAQAEGMSAPERIRKFGDVSRTGNDNVNVPALHLKPVKSWSGAQQFADRAGAVLVPIVPYYYAHNPGWFYGQEWGCSSGARARIMWVIYSTADGRLLTWWDVETGLQEEKVRQPEEGVIEQLAQEVLRELGGLLRSEVDF